MSRADEGGAFLVWGPVIAWLVMWSALLAWHVDDAAITYAYARNAAKLSEEFRAHVERNFAGKIAESVEAQCPRPPVTGEPGQ